MDIKTIIIDGEKYYLYTPKMHNAAENNKIILDEVAEELPLLKKEMGLC